MSKVIALLCAFALWASAGCSRQAPQAGTTRAAGPRGSVDLPRAMHAEREPSQWLLNGRTFYGERFSPLTQITAANVAKVGFAWEFRDFVVRGRTHHGLESN